MYNFEFAMKKSYDYMTVEVNNILDSTRYSDEERQRLFYACGTCLHWILDYAERVDVPEEDMKIISAFRFANDALKHKVNLFEITEQTGGLKFPIAFPLAIEKREIRWKELEDKGKYESQYKNYNAFLCGKSVLGTCKSVLDILLQMDKET